jgi:hypothetical protein
MDNIPHSAAARPGSNTIGIISMVLGIFALLVSVLPYFGAVGLLFALPAVVMGIIGCAQRRGQSVVTPIIGLVTGGIGLLFSGGWALMFIVALTDR